MTYEEAVMYVESMGANTIKLGLERIKELLKTIGNPQESLKIIHVAGTNGKGSFCSFISSILEENGYKVGVYTSPHLISYKERYMINGECISEKEFSDLMEYIKSVSENINPTPFEILTAAAFKYFEAKRVDFVVLETGLGGRFDATNVTDNTLLSVITQIGMDHMEYLGDTIEKIAFEKGGIIKKNRPAVLYFQDIRVYNVICGICEKMSSELFYPNDQRIEIVTEDFEKTVFNLYTKWFEYKNLSINLIGDYQVRNAANAVCAAYALKRNGVFISEEGIRAGLENACWKGRMELIEGSPKILLEGAHNIDGIKELRKSLEIYCKEMPITLLLGVLGDKEYGKMIEEIVPLCKRVVLTEPQNDRALDIKILAEKVSSLKKAEFASEDIAEAFEYACSSAEKDGIVCCAGSLYLIGAIKKYMIEKEN